MHRTHSVSVSIIAIAISLAVSVGAGAEDAKAVYDKAVEDFKAANYLEAAEGFRRAYDLKPSWKLYYNIGQSEAAAKRHGLALEAFETYLSKGGDDINEARRDEVMKEVDRLRKMVGSVEIVAPKDSEIFVDDVQRGTAPLLGKLPVAASVKHIAYAMVGEEKTDEVPFKVMGGDTFKVVLEAKDEEVGPTAPIDEGDKPGEEIEDNPDVPEPAADDPGKKLRTAGWVLVGVGGAAIIGGAITGGMAKGVDDDLDDACQDGHCEDDKQGDIDKLNTLSLTTDILIGVGAAAAITGVVLVIVGHKKKGGESEVAVTPAFGDGFTGAAISGRF